jgi:hypothetical protein
MFLAAYAFPSWLATGCAVAQFRREIAPSSGPVGWFLIPDSQNGFLRIPSIDFGIGESLSVPKSPVGRSSTQVI